MKDERNNDANVAVSESKNLNAGKFGITKAQIQDLFNAYNNRGGDKPKIEGKNIEYYPAL
jgi:hypothetical protein